MSEIKLTAKGKQILKHGAPEGFITEDPIFKQGGSTFIKYDRLQVRPENDNAFRGAEMAFYWQGHEIMNEKVPALPKDDIAFTLTGIIGYIEVLND